MYKEISNELSGKVGYDGETIIFSLKTYEDTTNDRTVYRAIVVKNNMIIDESAYHENKSIVKEILEKLKNKYGVQNA